MTRINCIPPEDLHYQHLVAEYRELPRIFNQVRNFMNARRSFKEIPIDYRMGTGHVLFFFNKLKYLSNRFDQLVGEMIKRGYTPKFTENLETVHSDLPKRFWEDWTPDQKAIDCNMQRLIERNSEFYSKEN